MKLKILPIILILTLDLALLCLVSSIIAFGFYLIIGSFMSPFLLTLGILSFVGYISNKIIEKRSSVILNGIDLEKERLSSNQSLTVNCAYCKVPNTRKLNLNSDMAFECLNCKQVNRIIFSYGAARITTPLNVSMPTQAPINDD